METSLQQSQFKVQMPEWVVAEEPESRDFFNSKLDADIEAQTKLVKQVLNNPNGVLDKHEEFEDVFDLNLSLVFFINESKDPKEMLGLVVDHIYKNSSSYNYKLDEAVGSNAQNGTDYLVDAIKISGNLIRAIHCLSDKSDEESKRMLGIFVDNNGYVNVLNKVREDLNNNPDAKVKRSGRVLMGLDPDDNSRPFHLQLADVYKALKFEEYKPNLASTDREVALIKKIISEQIPDRPSTDITILDVGCGTGRISNPLAEEYKVIGVDESETNLDTAKRLDASGMVDYKLASILDNDIPDDSVDCVILPGRTIPHSENVEGFFEWMGEIKRVLKPNGILIFDSPNPDKGRYLQNRKNFVKIIQGLGIPVTTQQGLDRYPYLIDSPDGTNFYNRLVLPTDGIVDYSGWLGFDTAIVDIEPIYSDSDDENIYYLAKCDGVRRDLFNYTSRIY